MTTVILIILALTFTITSLIFKKGFLSFAGAGAWMIATVHCFSMSAINWDTYFSLAFLFIGLTLVCVFAPLAWRETTKEGDEAEDPDTRELHEEMENWNRERRQYNFLYSGNSGNGKGKRGRTRYQRTKTE